MHCIAFVFQIAMEKFEIKRVMLCFLAKAISREKNGMYFYIILYVDKDIIFIIMHYDLRCLHEATPTMLQMYMVTSKACLVNCLLKLMFYPVSLILYSCCVC